MAVIEIKGIQCEYRDLKEGEEIIYSDLPVKEQKFKRVVHPFTDDELANIATKEHNYSAPQTKWKEKQEEIFNNGVYAMIKGTLTFIPGAYWCYINFWTLEHGEKPDYREDDRRFFLFHEYLRLETDALGLIRGKGRRQGATSIAMFFMWFIAGRQEHKLCGLTSFSDTAAADAFQKMFMYGFKSMLPCFQAESDSDSENFVRFVKPIEKKKKNVLALKREGLNSYCDYKPNTINSYDSGRQSYNVPDETGKRTKLDISSYWSRLYKTFLVGNKKVGFAYMPTTVGAKKDGGENFKKFYKNANQFEIDKTTGATVGINTINRCVRYFAPATECFAGCIDEYGFSVVEDPAEPVMGNDGQWIKEGSRTIILRERKRLEGDQLMEHRRDYPLDEYDLFAFETGKCEFNEKMIVDRVQYLEEHPEEAYWRKVRFSDYFDEEDDVKHTIPKVKYVDDERGGWEIFEEPEAPNMYRVIGGRVEAENTLLFSSGADTYRNIFAEDGSEGVIVIMKKSHIVGGIEKGLYPVAIFFGRPKLIQQFNWQAFLGCLYYGCKINYEIDAGTWFYENFLAWKAERLLEWTPAVDPTKPTTKLKPGTESASPFQLAKQLEVGKLFFDGDMIDGYNGNIHRVTHIPMLKQALEYNHSERTPYHYVVALMMALLPMLAHSRPPRPKPARAVAAIPTFKIAGFS